MSRSGQALSPGIRTSINEAEFPIFPNYLDDVRAYRKTGQDHGNELPFVNQEKPLVELVSKIASRYPYACLLGESGIGKTMMISYVADIITEKIPLDDVREQIPEIVPALERIKSQASMFEHRDYLLLPNLRDGMIVDAIDYTDSRQSEKDLRAAENFCDDVTTVLGNYARDNRRNIRIQMTGDKFRQYIRSRVSELYVNLYEEVCDNTQPERITGRSRKPKKPDFAVVTVEPPESPNRLEKKDVVAEWKFVTRKGDSKPNVNRYKTLAGFARNRTGVDIKMVEEGLPHAFVTEEVQPLLSNLLWELTVSDVVDGDEFYSEEDMFDIFREEFRRYTDEVVRPMKDKYLAEEIQNQRQMLSHLKTSEPKSDYAAKVSPRTLDDIVGRLRTLRAKYMKDMCSPELHRWMDSVVAYFDSERPILEKTVSGMLEDIRDIEKKRPPKLLSKKERDEKDKEEQQVRGRTYQDVKFELTYQNVKFKLRHGKYDMEIGNIMKVNAFRDSSSTGGVTTTEVREFNEENLFGTFDEHTEELPPHMIYKTLGDFFKGGILTFPDCFTTFVESIVGYGGMFASRKKSTKEIYLSYFESKVMTVTHDGITFRFKAPKILMGSDNFDPFISLWGILPKNEPGLRDRIALIDVYHYADNRDDVRKGTLKVFTQAIDDYNRANGDAGGRVEMTDEALEMLLRYSLYDEHVAVLFYRSFIKEVESICDFAKTRGETRITPELLRERVRERIPPAFFWEVDRKAKEVDGWLNLPESQPGLVCGLSAYSSRLRTAGLVGDLVKVRSYFVPDRDPLPREVRRFEFSDIESELVDETTVKGYSLACDWLKEFIYDLRSDTKTDRNGRLKDDEGWQVKTVWEGRWDKSGGPSASLAIAASMVSALSGEETFKNRFVTGTLDPSTGNAGAIGGTYLKGLIPTRLHDLMPDDIKEPLYFLFPAPNLKDLTREAIFDPFGIERKIVCLPVRNIADTYHLLTCGPEILEQHWENIDELGPAAFDRAKKKIRQGNSQK